ncbi:MAG: ribosome maturation factor RimP [Lachnospiraceae bacterium]|nr:ribosome maturation factor RimP [Lachnospiraceae bacterium]
MSRKESYEATAEQLIAPILQENGFELVDMEYVKEGSSWYLRAYIDKEGGITIDDCELVSRAFSDVLDREDPIEEAYILEVSSPGLLRPLKKDRDFERKMGERIELRTYRMEDGKKEFEGVLKAFDKTTVTVECEDGERVFERAGLALVRPYVEF